MPLTEVGALGVSGMMHGYLPFDRDGKALTAFRTWRNTITGEAAERLTERFGFNIPQRWSVAHLYQAMLNGEEHLPRLDHLTTLDAQGPVHHHHGEVAGPGGDVARAHGHGVGSGHAGARVALRRGQGDAGAQCPGGVQEQGPGLGEASGVRDINAWVDLFAEFAGAVGAETDKNRLYTLLFQKALEGEPDCGGLLSYNYFSGEGVTDLPGSFLSRYAASRAMP